jgi:hypothetical protein
MHRLIEPLFLFRLHARFCEVAGWFPVGNLGDVAFTDCGESQPAAFPQDSKPLRLSIIKPQLVNFLPSFSHSHGAQFLIQSSSIGDGDTFCASIYIILAHHEDIGFFTQYN